MNSLILNLDITRRLNPTNTKHTANTRKKTTRSMGENSFTTERSRDVFDLVTLLPTLRNTAARETTTMLIINTTSSSSSPSSSSFVSSLTISPTASSVSSQSVSPLQPPDESSADNMDDAIAFFEVRVGRWTCMNRLCSCCLVIISHAALYHIFGRRESLTS